MIESLESRLTFLMIPEMMLEVVLLDIDKLNKGPLTVSMKISHAPKKELPKDFL